MSLVTTVEAETVMRFFRAHRAAETLARKGEMRELNRADTHKYIAATEEREALRAAVIEINQRSLSVSANQKR